MDRLDVLPPHEIDRLTLDVVAIQFQEKLEPEIASLMSDFGGAAMGEVGLAGASFNLIDARVLGILNEFSGVHIHSITATTRRALQIALQKGVLAGEGANQIARRVSKVMEQSATWRARTIARTEVNAAANGARLEAFRQSGRVPFKRWLATLDGRLRPDHLRLHNQVRRLNEAFEIGGPMKPRVPPPTLPGGGPTAQRPSGFGIAKQDVNCRCVIVPFAMPRSDAEGPLQSDRNTIAAFDRMSLKWEARIEEVLRRIFKAIERRLLADLLLADVPER